HGLDEGVHQAPVAAAVAAAGAGVAGRAGRQHLGPLAEEVEDPDGLAVALELAVAAEQPGAAVAAGVEPGHGEGSGGPAVELHGHHLVVDHVVVGAVDAAPVRAVAQRRPQVGLGVVVAHGVQGPAGAAFQAAAVEADGRVRAGGLDPAVQAAVGGPGRAVLGPEVGQPAEARHPPDAPPDPRTEALQV